MPLDALGIEKFSHFLSTTAIELTYLFDKDFHQNAKNVEDYHYEIKTVTSVSLFKFHFLICYF